VVRKKLKQQPVAPNMEVTEPPSMWGVLHPQMERVRSKLWFGIQS